jgi:hypothetical protein
MQYAIKDTCESKAPYLKRGFSTFSSYL